MNSESGAAVDSGASPPFFPVSIRKFAVLECCTFGAYGLFWFYRNWQLAQRRDQLDILPFWRAFFTFFFCYAFFERVRDYPTSTGRPALPAGALAAGFIVLCLAADLPDPFGLVSIFACLFLLPVQAAANRVNAEVAPDHDRNSRFTAWNWLTVVVGGSVLVLAVIGAFLPPV